jgi:hypothetical protein
MSKSSVICIAKNETQAIDIVQQLKASNFTNNDISVLMPDRSGTKDFAHEQHTKAPEGATAHWRSQVSGHSSPRGPSWRLWAAQPSAERLAASRGH